MTADRQQASNRLVIESLDVFRSGKPMLYDVNLALARGSMVGLIGPNAAGKSTLMKALMGLLETRGSVKLDGRDLLRMPSRDRARLIGYLPQEHSVAWPVSVEALVMLGRAPHRSGFAPPAAADTEAVERAIAVMELGDLRGRTADGLSGGELARVLIARVLAQDTDVVFADEPTAGLDPSHQIGLMETFHGLASDGKTLLVSLHDLPLAAQWCDRIVLFDRGRVVSVGPPGDVLTPDHLRRVYGVTAFVGEAEGRRIVVPLRRV